MHADLLGSGNDVEGSFDVSEASSGNCDCPSGAPRIDRIESFKTSAVDSVLNDIGLHQFLHVACARLSRRDGWCVNPVYGSALRRQSFSPARRARADMRQYPLVDCHAARRSAMCRSWEKLARMRALATGGQTLLPHIRT